jgi:hypothetical protein
LRLLENKVVELGIVDRASDSTIGRTLKKTFSSRIAGSAGSSRRRPTALRSRDGRFDLRVLLVFRMARWFSAWRATPRRRPMAIHSRSAI